MKLIRSILLFLAVAASAAFPVVAQEALPGASPALQKGNAGAPVTIEVFNDYQCPTCANFHKKLNAVQEKYPDTVLVIYRSYPLQVHKNSYKAALAVEAAGRQGKAFEMMDRLYERQSKWSNLDSTTRAFRNYAKWIGIDVEAFASDLESEDVKSRIEQDMARGKSLNITATPTVYLNGKILDFQDLFKLEKVIMKEANLTAPR